MKITKKNWFLLALANLVATGTTWAAGDLTSNFSGEGTIGNTRHNLSQRSTDGTYNGTTMDAYRNNYNAQVCVYCHTPHGANQLGGTGNAPLWNRTARTTTYTLYNQQTLSNTITQPGPNSLTCLSCHDGQTAVDSIVNMPGSDGYKADLRLDPTATQTSSLLNAWQNPTGTTDAAAHMRLTDGSCLSCHNPDNTELGAAATDFSVFAIGTDLRNDHPVGIKFPSGDDWNSTFVEKGKIKFRDLDGDSRPDKNEVRLYDTGEGFEVECASCHDPHGVPGTTSKFLPTFLRVTADGSEICLTCHIK